MHESTLERLPRPLLTAELKALTLPGEPRRARGALAKATIGVWFHDDVTETVDVPVWARDVEHWLNVREAVAGIQCCFPAATAGSLTGALLLGLPVDHDGATVHLTSPRGANRIQRPGIVSRRSKCYEVTSAFGVNIQTGPYLLLELAAQLSVEQLVRVLDAILGPWHGPRVTTKKLIHTSLEKHTGFRGRPRLLRALELAREGVGSPRETDLRLEIVAAGLPAPLVGYAIDLGDFGTVHPDLCYPGIKLVIEYEGTHHFQDQDQFDYDIKRYERLAAAGWTVIRVTKGIGSAWAIARIQEHMAREARSLF